MSDILKNALCRAREGFSVIWLKERSKAPVGRNWTEKPTASADDLKESYEDGYNVGVRLGKPSRINNTYLVAVDIDVRDPDYRDEAYKRAARILGRPLDEFPTVISGSGNGGIHLYALAETPHRSRKLWHTEESFTDANGKKHWCAEIEFFGTGKQVAMPPSIHPDSGKPYRWKEPFDADSLPLLDEDRLAALLGDGGDEEEAAEDVDSEPLGLAFSEAREIIDDLRDWADDRATWATVGMALKHEFGDRDGWRLFDAWSKTGKGYDRQENLGQWRSFGRSHKGRPVTMRSLMKERKDRDISDMLDDDSTELAAEFDDIPKAERQPARRPIPAHLLNIPGVLGEVVAYYNRYSIIHHPELAVSTAIALGSVVLGRHWSTPTNNFTSLYMLNVAETGTGKEYGFAMLERFLQEAGWDDVVIGKEKYSSDAALFGELFNRPRIISLPDEVGIYWGGAEKSGNSLQSDLRAYMMEIWSKGRRKLRDKGYSQRGMSKDQVEAQQMRYVNTPSLTILGATTPRSLYEALSYSMVVNGFLNRWLIVHSERGPQKKRLLEQPRAPKRIVKWIKDNIRPLETEDDSDFDLSLLQNPTMDPQVEVIHFTPKAHRELDRIEGMQIEEMERMKPYGFADLWTRTHEMVMKLAIVVARSCNSDVIQYEHVWWAGEYVFYHMRRTASLLVKHMDRLPIDDVVDKIAEKAMEAGEDGISVNQAMKSVFGARKLTPYQREEEIPDRLRFIHNIATHEARKGERGPKRKVFVHAKYLKSKRDE